MEIIGKLLFHKGKSHLAHVLLRSLKVVRDFPHILCVEECSLSQKRKEKQVFLIHLQMLRHHLSVTLVPK